MKWREKQLPHYFGRLVHALDLVKYSQNEGTLLKCQVHAVQTYQTPNYKSYEIKTIYICPKLVLVNFYGFL